MHGEGIPNTYGFWSLVVGSHVPCADTCLLVALNALMLKWTRLPGLRRSKPAVLPDNLEGK